ncbi:hypothetical protein A2Z33_04735 [Candidatus Gottesmanbacteria bacterium RBG_16_52_11]|uniref:Transposase IS200-like domain-containing protein n=1 Tax=Candidatus Gottesmanbacteria bacterium RBG_16_52_11 TaxID=1798374 RepID=A0A1F5YUI7_9BACT|nr:MAG: hypothetical protein A2Z33_04735 [Candidatus Gottesmanbacteria bacterium RBG_16_52_11]
MRLMAKRKTLLVNDEIYHVYNRSAARQPVLTGSGNLNRFINLVNFYRFKSPGLRYSHYTRLALDLKKSFLDKLSKSGQPLVEIYVFALMPNHYHFLMKQLLDEGIKIFASHIQNSYARYYNTKYDRVGSIWQEMFKAERIETDEQFIHLARYIHLNPLTSFIIKYPVDLEDYRWTSYSAYSGKYITHFLKLNNLREFFSNTEEFKQFTFDNLDYQRTLDHIKHLTSE